MRGGLNPRIPRRLQLRPRRLVFLAQLLLLLLLQLDLLRLHLLVDEHARAGLVDVGEQALGVVGDLERLLRLAGLVRLEHLFALVLVDGAAGGVEEEARGLVEALGALALEVDALTEPLLEDREGLGVHAAAAAAKVGGIVEVRQTLPGVIGSAPARGGDRRAGAGLEVGRAAEGGGARRGERAGGRDGRHG